MAELTGLTPDEFKSEFKRKAYGIFAAGMFTILGAIGVAAWAVIESLPGKIGLVPPGTVAAFDLQGNLDASVSFDAERGCPSGWSPYDKAWGRFVIGAVADVNIASMRSDFGVDKQDQKISARPLGRPGGEQQHLLKPEEMPRHNHDFQGTAVTVGGWGGRPADRKLATGDPGPFEDYTPAGTISFSGKGQPHDIMPPYVALLMCRKD